MKAKNIWVDITILNLCIVAFLGFVLRSKALFSLSWINYLYLLDVHSHFAFEGWVTLALLFLFVNELLAEPLRERKIYTRVFAGIVVSSFVILLSVPFDSTGLLATFISFFFILITYLFGWVFLKDIQKTRLNRTIRLLSISAIISLILSSVGPITITWLHATKSLNAALYQQALYFYLHFQYNGFFTLGVLALLLHKLYSKISIKEQKNFHLFSVLICISIVPSLFLSFLWQNPNIFFRVVAIGGSTLILASVGWFIYSALPVLKYSSVAIPVARYIFYLSIGAFVLKMVLQGLTIFPLVGNSVFGDRPVIIGYLHLVFLGFVSPFILAYYVQKTMLNIHIKLTRYALIVFLSGVICNEIVLMVQGLGAMFLKGSIFFYWLLWVVSLWLTTGAILIFSSRIKSRISLSETRQS